MIQRDGLISAASIRMQFHACRFVHNQTEIILKQDLRLSPSWLDIDWLRRKKGQPKPVPCELYSSVCFKLT
ncbi:hypothetical protein D3C74_446060 [compost metagenome]